MATYFVKLLSPEGEILVETIEANNDKEIFTFFGDQDYIILEYRKDRLGNIRKFFSEFSIRKSISKSELADFCYYLGRALDMGIPILDILDDLEKAAKKAFYRKIIRELKQQISAGSSISEAMRGLKVFPGDLIGLTKLGEETDALSKIFLNYAGYLDWRIKIEKEVKKALTYPAFVSIVLIFTILILFGFILPEILPVIKSLGLKEYPLPTKILIVSGFIFKHFWLHILLSIVGIFAVIFLTVRKSRRIKYLWHRLKLRLPLVGEIFLKASLSKDIRAIAEVFRSGGTILFSIQLIEGFVEQNLYIKKIFKQIEEFLLQGDMLSIAMEKTGFFEVPVIRMVKLGEDTGAIDRSLSRLAEIYQDDMKRKIETLTIMIEPLLQLILGAILGILALGMLLPVYNVLTNIK